MGEFEKADRYFQQNIELDPKDIRHYGFYALNFIKRKQLKKAAEFMERAEKIEVLHPRAAYADIVYYRSILFAAQGEREKALTDNPNPHEYVYSLLGMKDEAINKLILRIERGCHYLDLIHNPFFDALRDDLRFQDILEKEKNEYDRLVKIYHDL